MPKIVPQRVLREAMDLLLELDPETDNDDLSERINANIADIEAVIKALDKAGIINLEG